jgi:competence protein ComEA
MSLLQMGKRERNAILLIIILEIGVVFFSKQLDTNSDTAPIYYVNKENDDANVDNKKKYKFGQSHKSQFTTNPKKRILHLQLFDPNKLDSVGWVNLGLPNKLIKTILNYRKKGGKFRNPEDMKKIWGMPMELAEQLMPYVNIESMNDAQVKKPSTYLLPKKNIASIEMNMADSAAWESLAGIGPVLASRIVAYRNKLGGFVSVQQLKEVWGLPDSVYQTLTSKLKVKADGVVKKDINISTWQELKAHPYIGYKLANTIVRYRNQHGNFKTLNDIQQILELDESSFQWLQYYFKVSSEN